MWAILWMVLTQVPCAPGESTVVCQCKQGVASACEILSQTDPNRFEEVRQILTPALPIKAASKEEDETESAPQGASAAPEPPDCKGQLHHVISRRIARELDLHPVLRGRYKPRDSRFVTRAKDEPSHCGYQSWHKDLDDEVIAWLRRNKEATPEEFEAFLREIYRRPSMRVRFPNGF